MSRFRVKGIDFQQQKCYRNWGELCVFFFPAITARTLSYLLKTKVTSDLTDLRINMQNRLEYVFETAISTYKVSKSQFGSY